MKKILLILLAMSFLTGIAIGCSNPDVAADAAGSDPERTPEPLPNLTPDSDDPGYGGTIVTEIPGNLEPPDDNDFIVLPGNMLENTPEFIPFTGIVTKTEIAGNLTHIEIENLNGDPPSFFTLSEETVFPFSKDFAIGDEVTVWYLSFTTYGAVEDPVYVLASRMGDDRNIKVDRFHISDISADRYFISADKMLMFKVDENTEIVFADGRDFSDGNLDGRRIIVIYGAASTMGDLEQATAEKLIVLDED